jgi:hypothetical protein
MQPTRLIREMEQNAPRWKNSEDTNITLLFKCVLDEVKCTTGSIKSGTSNFCQFFKIRCSSRFIVILPLIIIFIEI